MRRIGALMTLAESGRQGQTRIAAFRDGLQELGWAEGSNVRIDYRWAAPSDSRSMQLSAKELIALHPDLILSQNTPTTAALLQQTRDIPVVMVTARTESKDLLCGLSLGADGYLSKPFTVDALRGVVEEVLGGPA